MNEFEAMALAAAARKRKQEAAAQMTAGGSQSQTQSSAGDTEARRRKLRLLQEQARVKAPALQQSRVDPQSLTPAKQDDALATYEEIIAKARELDAAGERLIHQTTLTVENPSSRGWACPGSTGYRRRANRRTQLSRA